MLFGSIVVFVSLLAGLLFTGTLSDNDLLPTSLIPAFFAGILPVLTPLPKVHINYERIDSLDGKVAIVTGANIGLGKIDSKFVTFQAFT